MFHDGSTTGIYPPKSLFMIAALILAGFGVPKTFAAIVVGNTASTSEIAASSGGGQSATLSFTNNGDFLAVSVAAVSADNGLNSSTSSPISVVATYNGVELTQAGFGRKGNDEYSTILYLTNPTAGTFDLEVDFGTSLIGSATGVWKFGAVSLMNVDDSDPIAGLIAESTGSNLTLSSQSAGEIQEGELLLTAIGSDGVETSPHYLTADGGQTQLFYETHPDATPTRSYGSTYKVLTAGDLSGANNDEVVLTRSGNSLKAVTVVAFNEVPEPASLVLVGVAAVLMIGGRTRERSL